MPPLDAVIERLRIKAAELSAKASIALFVLWLLLLLASMAVGWFAYAAFLAFSVHFSPAASAAFTACGMLVIAGMAALLGYVAMTTRRKPLPPTLPAEPPTEKAYTPTVAAVEIDAYVRKHPKSSVIAGLLAGAILGVSPEIRSAVADAIRVKAARSRRAR